MVKVLLEPHQSKWLTVDQFIKEQEFPEKGIIFFYIKTETIFKLLEESKGDKENSSGPDEYKHFYIDHGPRRFITDRSLREVINVLLFWSVDTSKFRFRLACLLKMQLYDYTKPDFPALEVYNISQQDEESLTKYIAGNIMIGVFTGDPHIELVNFFRESGKPFLEPSLNHELREILRHSKKEALPDLRRKENGE